jgi:NADH-quinone oxidoreductase subunit H
MEFIIDPINFLKTWLEGMLLVWGVSELWVRIIILALGAVLLPTLAMFGVIILIWLERKILARFQDRIGPNRIGPWGILQTFPDMFKIFTKEFITPLGVDWLPYNLAPILNVGMVLMVWAVIPLMVSVVGINLNVGVLYILAVGGLGSLSFILAGWGSNNKFALLGAFRAVALLLTYEIPMAITLLIPVMFSGSLGLVENVSRQHVWNIFLSPVAALIFFITLIAENGRSPFDLIEADSELVSGFNIEYSGLKFGMFYVADFLHAFTLALLFAVLFLGGWRGPFAEQVPLLGFVYLFAKTSVVYFIGLWIRGSMPRLRIDQMLNLSWKILTPLSMAILVLTALVEKIIPAAWTVVHVVVLVALNAACLVATDWLMSKNKTMRPRPVVAPKPLPVARFEEPGA